MPCSASTPVWSTLAEKVKLVPLGGSCHIHQAPFSLLVVTSNFSLMSR